LGSNFKGAFFLHEPFLVPLRPTGLSKPKEVAMLKIAMTLAVATLLIGVSVDTEPQNGALKFMASPQAQAHVLNWEHKHVGATRKRDKHKMGTGSVTE
jgi:hypothetical protein